ncbi:hypothetical protein [Shinella sp. BYT-45]|uniref:hypothetical protein n=1 Tax=Shinella sp. BYT-45 TaxID=3377377 RepID=UPI00397EC264
MNAVARITTPSEICSAVQSKRRTSDCAKSKKTPSDAKIASSSAIVATNTDVYPPRSGKPNTDDGHYAIEPQECYAVVGSPYPGTNPAHHETINAIVEIFRMRQDMIRARTKLILQAQASLRRVFAGDKKLAAKIFAEASKDPGHEYRGQISFYLEAIAPLENEQSRFERELVRDVKSLPIYAWAKSIKGFGDLSLACIIGEASGYANKDIYHRNKLHIQAGQFYSVGDFKSVSALWKRIGVAVINGHRQGNPGKGATAKDWIDEGYSKSKRSTMWNIGNSLILSMGKFRPVFGEDVDANDSYTYYQKVFANRARYEANGNCPKMVETKKGSGKFVPKLDANGEIVRIERSDSGKESYSAHAAKRAKRYTEKRLLRNLYAEWRKVMA